MVAGVLGGLAEKFGMEPFPMRVLYLMLTLVTAIVPGVAAYLGIWAITRLHGPEATRPALWRSRTDTVLAGVIGGLSEKIGLPSGLARVSYAILTVGTGIFPGILAYLMLWMFTPTLDAPGNEERPAR
jgi:phage shock protein PspC (stress-responsive transcriptional regulator)